MTTEVRPLKPCKGTKGACAVKVGDSFCSKPPVVKRATPNRMWHVYWCADHAPEA